MVASSINRRRTLAVAALALAALTLCGCTSSDTGRSRVQGAVSYDGEPVDDGGIAFIPEAGGESQVRATGEIRDGHYYLDTSSGPFPGKYRVEIYWHKKTGRKIASPSGKAFKEETKQVIPAKYNDKTELKADIKPGRNSLDFDLK
jgi:hypothetical protein